MIERHVSLVVSSGCESDLETLFIEKYGPAMRRQAGFVGVDLLRLSEGSGNYRMAIRFESAELAGAWRASAEHAALSPLLKILCSSSETQDYEVVSEVTSAGYG